MLLLGTCASLYGAEMKVHLSWGHAAPKPSSYYVRPVPATPGVEVRDAVADNLESGEGLKGNSWQSTAGGGDVDGVHFTLTYPDTPDEHLQNLHIIWADLIANSDPDTARRLGQDPAFHLNAHKVTIFMDAREERGFTVSTDQLREQKALWIPSLDMYVTAGDDPVPYAKHVEQLSAWKGQRILDRVHSEPEATYDLYKSRWEDMGSPAYVHPKQPLPGHIIGLTWDSAIAKFGIDRGAGARNDYGNPDKFQFWYGFGDLASGIIDSWKGQGLKDGLPVVTTVFEKEGTRYEVEQFAYPLNGPPSDRRGDIPMVLLQKVKITDLQGTARKLPVTMSERRLFPSYLNTSFIAETDGKGILFRDSAYRQVLLGIEGVGHTVEWGGLRDYQHEQKRLNATVFVDLPANGSREFVVKLPSPMVPAEDAPKFPGDRLRFGTHGHAELLVWMGRAWRQVRGTGKDGQRPVPCHSLARAATPAAPRRNRRERKDRSTVFKLCV